MAHTNSTTNYNLPQFVPTDKPAWLTDINGAFNDIDNAIKGAKDAADDAQADATQALSDAAAASGTATGADAKATGAIASIENAFDPTTVYPVGALVMYNSLLYKCTTAVTTPGPWTGSANWTRVNVDSLISNAETVLQGNIDTLALATSYIPGNVALHAGLSGTLNRGYAGKQVRIALVDVLFTINGAVSGGIPVIDLPANLAAANTTDLYGFNSSNTPTRFYISGNQIFAHSTITAGTYIINAVYTTN